MILLFDDSKITANQAGKYLVYDKGTTSDYWQEMDIIQVDKLTEKETADIEASVTKHQARVHKFLGINKVY